MKKILSLLTLLVTVVTGAWAADFVTYSSASSGPTFPMSVDGVSLAENGDFNVKNQTNSSSEISSEAGMPSTKIHMISFRNSSSMLDIDAGANKKITSIIIFAGRNSSGNTVSQFGHGGFSNNQTTWSEISALSAKGYDYGTKITVTPTGDYRYYRFGRDKLGSTSPSSNSETRIYKVIVNVASAKTATAEALKSSAAVKVDGTALTKDAATSGYKVSSTTITLSDDIQYTSTPSDIKLVKTITYDDESTADEDVDVTFDGTVTDGYYIGTASIGLTGSVTDYTVKVKQDVTPTLTAAPTAVSVVSAGTERTVTFTLTGSNLTNGTYDTPQPSVTGLSITPATYTVAENALDQVFTVHYTATGTVAQANTVAAFEVDGATVDVTITYKGVTAHTQRTVSEIETWDWSNATGSDVNLSDSTTPAKDSDNEIVASDFDGEVYAYNCGFPSKFDAIVMYKFQRPKNGSYYQGQTLKLNTSVPGIVTVRWANTGGKRPNRYLSVNGTISDEGSGDGSSAATRTTSVPVEAGTITLTGIYEPTESNYSATDKYDAYDNNKAGKAQYLNYYSVTFTPTATVTTNKGKWASFTPSWNATLSDGAQAYIITAVSETSVTASTVDVLSAGTGYFVKGAAAETAYTATATADDATATAGNKIVGTTTDITINGEGNTKYVLGTAGEVSGLFKVDSEVTVAAGKAYLDAGTVLSARQLSLNFDEGTTGITTVEEQKGLLDGDFYNVAGQRVAQPTKGLYIVNGKKIILK